MRGFAAWWALTIALGAIFIAGTGIEWHKLIYVDGLTIRTNLFGTTFYSLVGLHATHVVVGLIGLSFDFDFYADGTCEGAALGAHSGVRAVLAFCGCGVGGGFHRGVHRGQVEHGGNDTDTTRERRTARRSICPAPTAWPIVLAFGCTMAAAGLVTNLWVTAFGAVLMLAGCVGWFRQVLPHEAHEELPVVVQPVTIATTRKTGAAARDRAGASRAPAGGDVSDHQRD